MRGITARSIPHIPLRHSLGREGGRRVILLLPKKPFAAQLGPSPNDGHAHVGGMDWLSKILGAENFWMAILLIPIKTDQLRGRPKPERWACPMRRHGLPIKSFRGRKFLDGDSVDSYKNGSAARSAQTRTMGMPDAAAWVGYQNKSDPKNVGWRFCGFL